MNLCDKIRYCYSACPNLGGTVSYAFYYFIQLLVGNYCEWRERKFKKKIKKINILIKYSIEQIISYGCFEKLLAKIKIYKNN